MTDTYRKGGKTCPLRSRRLWCSTESIPFKPMFQASFQSRRLSVSNSIRLSMRKYMWVLDKGGGSVRFQHSIIIITSAHKIIPGSRFRVPKTELIFMSDVTQILKTIEQGEAQAAGQLLPLVYDELRRVAVQKLAQEKPGQTLQPTALVHEAFLRLVGNSDEPRWDNCGHFFAAAAEAMRRMLIENARRKKQHRSEGRRV